MAAAVLSSYSVMARNNGACNFVKLHWALKLHHHIAAIFTRPKMGPLIPDLATLTMILSCEGGSGRDALWVARLVAVQGAVLADVGAEPGADVDVQLRQLLEQPLRRDESGFRVRSKSRINQGLALSQG